MTKFKVGDKVVCIDSEYADYWLDEGRCYSVREYVYYSALDEPEVFLDESGISWMESRFELLEEWEKHQRKVAPEIELQLAQMQVKSLQEKLKDARMLLAKVVGDDYDLSCALFNDIEIFLGVD